MHLQQTFSRKTLLLIKNRITDYFKALVQNLIMIPGILHCCTFYLLHIHGTSGHKELDCWSQSQALEMCPYIVIFCQKADLKRFCCLSPLYPITVCILFVIGYSGDNKLASDLLYANKRQCRTQVTRLSMSRAAFSIETFAKFPISSIRLLQNICKLFGY